MDLMGIVGAGLCLIGIGIWVRIFASPKFPALLAEFEAWSRRKFPRLSAWFPPCDCVDVCHCAQSEPTGERKW